MARYLAGVSTGITIAVAFLVPARLGGPAAVSGTGGVLIVAALLLAVAALSSLVRQRAAGGRR